MFISGIDMTIVNVALPDISRDLGAGINELQWVLDGFLVALGALLLLGTGLGDRFGRRRVFVGAFLLFGVASGLAALSDDPIQLIGARVLMGAAVAGIMPTALALITVMFPVEERARAISIWAVVAGVAIGVGPVLGGVLVASLGWPAVFLVNIPVAILAAPAGLALLPESRRPGAPPLDLGGVALSTIGLGGVVFALIEGPSGGWGQPVVIAAAVAGIAGLAAFVVFERRRLHPLFDLGVLVRPRVIAGAVSLFGCYLAFFGVLFLLPQYLQYVQGRSPAVAGLAILPLGFAMVPAAIASGRMVARWGPRATLVASLCGMAAATALLLLIGPATPLGLVLVAMGLFGACEVGALVPATSVVLNDLGTEKAGDGGAVNQLARQIGGATGVALVGSLFGALYRSALSGGLAGLPAPARATAQDSIEGARQVAEGLGGGAKAALLAHADLSFDVGARAGVALCLAALLAAALVAFIGLGRPAEAPAAAAPAPAQPTR
jgi:EmrB/QacA subfamily drug resistance transporter